jgi:uncharacterized membrane protein YcaP (DUF421 family)
MSRIYDVLNLLLGLDAEPKDLTLGQTLLRAFIVFVIALVMVRMGSKRFLSKMTAFDAILGFILASMLARAVNGSAAFFPTLAAGFLLVALHRVTAYLACVSHHFGNLVKGHCVQVVKEGKVIEPAMHKHNLTEHDLEEEMRLNANVEDVAKIKAAYLERSGQISMVKE